MGHPDPGAVQHVPRAVAPTRCASTERRTRTTPASPGPADRRPTCPRGRRPAARARPRPAPPGPPPRRAANRTKSSYSSSEGGRCLEVATALRAIHIRDSRQRPAAAEHTLCPSPATWAAVTSSLK
ncbi:DUF397 domain-containing protein [Streptomyces sp. NPDC059168]|uniref:DUF397 domain-containing protein n=1 Tax=Streptomyces sp. NPDC059168 TaxID=3346753 RepID=UPI0036BB9A17